MGVFISARYAVCVSSAEMRAGDSRVRLAELLSFIEMVSSFFGSTEDETWINRSYFSPQTFQEYPIEPTGALSCYPTCLRRA